MKTLLCGAALAALLACAACKSPPGPEMTLVSGGQYKVGWGGEKATALEKPERTVWLHPFYVDKFEVANEDYAKFLDTSKHPAPPHWKEGKLPEGQGKHPVSNVSWDDAKAYCDWAGKRLPTEAEWEAAARGAEGHLYPWGPEWAEGKANTFAAGKGGPVAVGTFAEKGPSQTYDQAGNVWEWTSSDGAAAGTKIIKGGSYAPNEDKPRASLKVALPKDAKRPNVGFRCARDE